MDFKTPNIKKRLGNKVSSWRERISRELSRETPGGSSEGNSITVYFDGDEAYNAMLQAIRDAKHYIHLEMYMFFSDQTGSSFANALSEKARQGIPVRVLYDSIGSMDADESQWTNMRKAGVTVVEFRPVAPWRKRSGFWRRNHRKNLIIDGICGFTGGMNISDKWSAKVSGRSAWRDTHCQVIGPAADDLNKLFIKSWEYASEEKIFRSPDTAPLLSKEKIPQLHADQPPIENGSRCIVIGSHGLGGRKAMRRLFSLQLNEAKKSVRMTMPYFVPPKRLRKALFDARDRGVDTSILVPRDSDVGIVDYLREGLYTQMLRKKMNLIEYLGPILHAKTMVVDDNLAVIGSSNFDILSMVLNSETALVIFDDHTINKLNNQWHTDLNLSEKVDHNWKVKRPWWRLLAAKFGCLLIRRL